MTNVSIGKIISHYNIIGMAIAIAIGVAGQQFLFSITDNIIVPSINKVVHLDDDKNNFDIKKVISKFLTFLFVFIAVLIVLYVILRPMVINEIKSEEKDRQFLESRLNKITNDVDKLSGEMKELHEKIPKNSTISIV